MYIYNNMAVLHFTHENLQCMGGAGVRVWCLRCIAGLLFQYANYVKRPDTVQTANQAPAACMQCLLKYFLTITGRMTSHDFDVSSGNDGGSKLYHATVLSLGSCIQYPACINAI